MNVLQKILLLVFMLGALTVGAASAQENIDLNAIALGTIDAANRSVSFNFFAPLSGSYSITAAEIDEGLAPQFSVTDPFGSTLATVGNLGLLREIERTLEFPNAGSYQITVTSAANANGRFALRVVPGTPLAPVEPLAAGQPLEGTLATNAQRRFSAAADPAEPLVLMLDGGARVEITDSAGNLIGLLTSRLSGGSFRLPAGFGLYTITVLNDTPATLQFSIGLGTSSSSTETQPSVSTPVGQSAATQSSPVASAVPLPSLPSSGSCVLATRDTVPVNIRRTPSTEASIVGSLDPYETASVVGRNYDSSWYEIRTSRASGWVAGFVTRRGGDSSNCNSLRQTYTEPTAMPSLQPTHSGTQPTHSGSQTASDNEYTINFPYQQGGSATYSGAISYPDGDRQDTVRYTLTNVPSPLPNGNIAFRYNVSCSGHGVEHAQIVLGNGQSYPCTSGGTNFSDTPSGSNLSGAITMRLTNGSGSYVNWTVRMNWYIP